MKKNIFLFIGLWIVSFTSFTQTVTKVVPEFLQVQKLKATSVKNQAMTGTCWCFATTSLVESESNRKNKTDIDLSEMFTVRNIYLEKANNYILRQGKTQFGEGGLGHDMIRAVATYGAIPLSVYAGLPAGQTAYNHFKMFTKLQNYLDSILKKAPVSDDWILGYTNILDSTLGVPPTNFNYQGKEYTAKSFAKEVLHFNADDYISITSFTHQPYYKSFILQVPDNFANGSFYNVPLSELIEITKSAIAKGFTVSWDADVSNNGFKQGIGLALNLDDKIKYNKDSINADMHEMPATTAIRQLYTRT